MGIEQEVPASTNAVAAEDLLSQPPQGARVRVGLVDDDATMLEALSELIEQDPSLELVGTAIDAEAAQQLAISTEPDLMLMDVRMPGTGQKATAEILRVLPNVKILAHSVERDRSVIMEMLGAGVVGYVSKGSTGGELLKAIHDVATGRGVVSEEIASVVVDELAMRARQQESEDRARADKRELIMAVLDNPTTLSVAHQPFVDLASGDITGWEALARFDGPPHRSPSEWFEDAWEVGLGFELELLAIERSLQTLPMLDPDHVLALNVSPALAADPRLTELLGGGSLARLVLEITEHAPVRDYDALSRALRPMRQRGLRLAVDDAGAGYAGLRHILRLSPNLIKLDMDLTQGIEGDRARTALASAMIAFASEIDAEIIAEGIETEGELIALQALGVQMGQGYYLGRPSLISSKDIAAASAH
jgi:EAL domain-containing protein (putative c-di-GMP-specific phosphodiesterase class I)/CheY-like chemotaxis protein